MTHVQAEGEVFGRRLRELRQKYGVTQQQLSIATGLTEGYISNMERGLKVPSLTTILRLAVALGCKVTELVAIFDKTDLPSILRGDQ
ncbi:MAG: helix-turn-helix transcriptional regulator [Acidobacteria bacterium]|nr:helix-turn-helix transcriptional regulator [Acidobacteriota bacterium]MBV9067231.1 helix-turn-helix transcriptional regulator [Acidobacteriota bacterium]MBV9186486.1 helix-turn-helix transcriptional regulator [Acidobacteriota bacterium]